MSKPTHTVMIGFNGDLKIYKLSDVAFFKKIKGTSEFKCNKMIKENTDA